MPFVIMHQFNAQSYYASVSCPSLLCISFMPFVIMHQFHVLPYYPSVSCPSLLCISLMPKVIMHQFNAQRNYASFSCPRLLCISFMPFIIMHQVRSMSIPEPPTGNLRVVELVRNLVAHGDVRGGSKGDTDEWSG